MFQTEDILSISQLKNNLAQTVEEISHSGKSIIITQNGEAKVIVMDMKHYESWQKTLFFLKYISQSERDIKAGKVVDNDTVFKNLNKRLKTYNKF